MADPSESDRFESSRSHKLGSLMAKAVTGAISIAATAAIPILVQRHLASKPAAPVAPSPAAIEQAPSQAETAPPQSGEAIVPAEQNPSGNSEGSKSRDSFLEKLKNK